jgi:hypothetical protein
MAVAVGRAVAVQDWVDVAVAAGATGVAVTVGCGVLVAVGAGVRWSLPPQPPINSHDVNVITSASGRVA